MSISGLSREKMRLADVPKGCRVEVVGFRNGKETGSGFRGVVLGKYVKLLPEVDLEARIRLEILFGDGRELLYPGKFEVYCLGPEENFVPRPVVPGLRPSRILVR